MQLQVETWPIEKLVPYARNPRKNDAQVERMASAIQEFGFRIPIVAKSDGSVVDGHLRLKAAQKLGLTEVPVALADELTDAQVKAFRLLANKSANWAEWDEDLLKLELDELRDMDFDLELTGFDADELQVFEPVVVPQADEDDVPDVQENEPPVTKEGYVWLCGKHRVMCGDSTDAGSVALLMDGAEADLLLTGPPYNVALGMGGSVDEARKRHRRTDGLVIMNDKMEDGDFYKFLLNIYTSALNVMRPGAAFYIWHADNEGLNFRSALKEAGFTLRQTLIWKKNCITLGRQDYQWIHEPCLYGWKDGASHYWGSDRKQSTVIDFDKPSKSIEHPTMKPVELFEYQMLNSSKSGDVVLDLFGGSGTTMIAAEKNGRHARLMELDPKYCDVIVKRWQDYTGQKATLEADGRTFDEVANG